MKFFNKILIYFFGNIFNKLIVFLLLPLYTEYFDPINYGENDLAYTTVVMLATVLFLEPWIAVLRFSYDEKDKEGEQKLFTNTFVLIGICFPFYIIGCTSVSLLFHLPNIEWMILFGSSYLVINVLQFKTRAYGKNLDFVISGMISSIIQLIVSLFAILLLHYDAVVIFMSPFIGNSIGSIYLCVKNHYIHEFSAKFIEKKYLHNLFLFSYPLAINSIAFWGMTNINRYFARYFIGPEINGYISVSSKFTNIVAQLVSVFALAWQESAFESANKKSRSSYYSYVLEKYYIIMVIITSAIMLITNMLFTKIVGAAYYPAKLTMPLYFIASFFNAISNFYGHLFSAEKKTQDLSYSTIFGTITNVCLLFLTIGSYGMFSIPLCLASGYLVNVVFRLIRYQKINKLEFNYTVIIFGILLICISIVVCYIDNTYITLLLLFAILYYCVFYFKTNIISIYNSVIKNSK